MGGACCGSEAGNTSSENGKGKNRWHNTEHTEELKKLQKEESKFLDRKMSLYAKIALQHMENYEKVYGKEKAAFWMRSMSTGSPLVDDEYDDDDNGNKSYLSAPSSLDFSEVLIDVLSTSPDEVLNKDMWNLCDVIALVIWTFSNDRGVLGVDKTLLKLSSRRSVASQSLILNPTLRDGPSSMSNTTIEDSIDDALVDDLIDNLGSFKQGMSLREITEESERKRSPSD